MCICDQLRGVVCAAHRQRQREVLNEPIADPTPPSPTQHPGQAVDLDDIRERAATFAANSSNAMAAMDSADDVPALLAEVGRLTAHSTTLNTIGWRMAEALGRVPEGAAAVAGNPEEQLSALLADLDAAREELRRVEQERDDAILTLNNVREHLELVGQNFDKADAERDRMRPVVEAARLFVGAYRNPDQRPIEPGLFDAVDTYETQEGTNG